MIINMRKFLQRERPWWDHLEQQLKRMEQEPSLRLDLDEARRLHYLYERTAAALSQINTFSGDEALRAYVESLVGRAYALIHSIDRPRRRLNPLRWFFNTFPTAFQRHLQYFLLACAIMLAGAMFGGIVVVADDESKSVLIPFDHLHNTPSQRVQQEENSSSHISEHHSSFAAMLMANNIRVSMLALALGITFGIGTIVLLFYNGVILGAVMVDYMVDGQTTFLLAWLLPHGSIEIPAILIAGQAGLMLGAAMIGRQSRLPFKARLRQLLPDMVTLIIAVAVLLVWAGLVESFFSQYHQPVLPYWLKIVFGSIEVVLLVVLLRRRAKSPRPVEMIAQ